MAFVGGEKSVTFPSNMPKHFCKVRSAFAVVSLLSFVTAGQVSAADKPKYDINKPLGDVYVANTTVADEQTRLIIYRSPNAKPSGVVTVYLGDKYHASLQANAYSAACLDKDSLELRTRLTQLDEEINADQDTRYTLELKKSRTQFVRVTNLNEGKTALEEVPARVAQEELKNSQQQMHARTRASVVKVCKEPKAASKVADTYDITFGTEASFEYKKTDFNGITAKGKASLKEVIEKINSRYAHAVKVKVHVLGYADDSAQEADNKRISIARAEVVGKYFASSGFSADELAIEGLGSNSDPKGLTPGESKRLVEVEVTVTAR